MSAGYYKKVYERFEKLKDSASEIKTASSNTAYSSVFSMLPPPNRKVGCEADNSESSKKRSIKSVIKEHQNIIDNFIMSKTDIINRSKEAYKQIWEDFLRFSGSINPNAVSKYIRWKFQLDINLKDEETTLDGTALKYESVLSQFFNYAGIKLHRKFKLKYYSKNLLTKISVNF